MERCGIDNLCASTPFLRLHTRFAATVYNFVAPHLRESAGAGHVSTHTFFNVLYLKLCPLSAFGDDRRTTEYIRHRTAREALEKSATNQIACCLRLQAHITVSCVIIGSLLRAIPDVGLSAEVASHDNLNIQRGRTCTCTIPSLAP